MKTRECDHCGDTIEDMLLDPIHIIPGRMSRVWQEEDEANISISSYTLYSAVSPKIKSFHRDCFTTIAGKEYL